MMRVASAFGGTGHLPSQVPQGNHMLASPAPTLPPAASAAAARRGSAAAPSAAGVRPGVASPAHLLPAAPSWRLTLRQKSCHRQQPIQST